ncbi:DNA-directed DNA polymerase [Tanacetum coccineum]
MRAFIHEFKTTNELLFKGRNNSLSELRFEVQGLLRVINNTPISNREVKGVTTKGGKTTTQDVQDNDTNIHTKEPLVINHDEPVESNEVLTKDQPQKTNEPVVRPPSKVKTPPIPFPQRLRKEKEEAQHKRFLENLKQLHINLPFIEALTQMPKYAKFLKSLLINRARLEEACTITTNERCSAVLLNKLPSKEKDPRSFIIPCDIGQLHINNALADLGASISLMPYTMYEKLGLGEPKATRMSLELADRSIQYPRGIIKNVLIKVDKFILLIDFVILDMPEYSTVLIILGRPLLETARATIDVSSVEDDECYGVDELDDAINIEAQELLANDTSDSFLLKRLEKSIDQSDLESCKSFECKAIDDSDSEEPIRHIKSVNTPYPNTHIESDLGEPIWRIESVNTMYPVAQKIAEPNKVESEQLYSANVNEINEKKPELKILLQHLKYEYMHGDKYFPIIISSKLSEKEKMSLLQVLEKRKGANA